jgi:hypothetical protein
MRGVSRPRAASKAPCDMTRLQSVGGDTGSSSPQVVSCLVWCSGTVLRPNTRHAHSPTHHIQLGLCTHRYSQALYIHSQPSSPCAEVLMGSPHTYDGDAGRWTRKRQWQTRSAVWRTLVHGTHIQRRQAAPSSSGHTISPHAGRRSPLCVCQCLSSSGSPPRVMPSSFTAATLLPFRLLSRLYTPAWR